MTDFLIGRNNLSCTVFVPVDCDNNCPFCTTKKEYKDVSQEEVLKSVQKVLDSKMLQSSFIKEFVLTGGEPFNDLEKTAEILALIKKAKNVPVYINTSLPKKSIMGSKLDDAKVIFEIADGINISRHIGHDLKDVDAMTLIKFIQYKNKIRTNCLMKSETPEKDLNEFVDVYKNLSSKISFRANYLDIKDMNGLKSLDDPMFQMLERNFSYQYSNGCLVCNDDAFIAPEDFPISYHRGLESTLIKLPSGKLIVNDVIIMPNGEIRLDWGKGEYPIDEFLKPGGKGVVSKKKKQASNEILSELTGVLMDHETTPAYSIPIQSKKTVYSSSGSSGVETCSSGSCGRC